jgi:poly(3-hydroxybutyrate) depolymerase
MSYLARPLDLRVPSIVLLLIAVLLAGLAGNAQAQRQDNDDERMINDPRVQHRQYQFPGANESIPYALFVPAGYDAANPSPLIISLHGLGRSYDWLMGYQGFLDEAQAGGYIVVTPLGYIRRGWYGSRPLQDAPDTALRSEQDVMNVLRIVREEFSIDDQRIYLWGHSMGGAGAYHLARRWVDEMRRLGMQHLYLEVQGGDHSLLISQTPANMKRIVDFFNIVSKSYQYERAPALEAARR